MRKSQNRYFYHILVSPGETPGAITLNVVWMEREFDAYKLSRCMCPSKYNRFWDTAKYSWKKIGNFSYPLVFDAPVRGFPSEYCHAVWCGKTSMVWLPDGEKISNISLFVLAQLTNVTDRRTDGRTPRDGNSRPYASHRAAKTKLKSCPLVLLYMQLSLTQCYFPSAVYGKIYARYTARYFSALPWSRHFRRQWKMCKLALTRIPGHI